jgi:hypothetical protein
MIPAIEKKTKNPQRQRPTISVSLSADVVSTIRKLAHEGGHSISWVTEYLLKKGLDSLTKLPHIDD